MPSEPFSDSWLLYVPSSKQNGARDSLLWVQRNLMYIPYMTWKYRRQLYCQRPQVDLGASSAEHSCSEFISKHKSLASAHLPECCYDNSQHKCCCKQIYSKKMLKRNKPDAHFISHALLLKACYKENSFQTRLSEKVNDYSFLPGPQWRQICMWESFEQQVSHKCTF